MGQASLGGFDGEPLLAASEFAPSLAREIARQHGRAPPEVEVGYRRYTTLKSTARIAPGGKLVVTLCDDLKGKPQHEQAAIAHVLAARVLSRRAPDWAQAGYMAWLADPATRALSMEVRQARAKRRTLSPQGVHHDLGALLEGVVRGLFPPGVSSPPVAWTQGRARSVLASFDEAHELITVSRLLDHPRVREETVRYLLYHEMLHYEDFLAERRAGAPACRGRARRRRVHPPSFKERLHRFPGWKAAERDLARAFRRRRVE